MNQLRDKPSIDRSIVRFVVIHKASERARLASLNEKFMAGVHSIYTRTYMVYIVTRFECVCKALMIAIKAKQ